MFTSIQRGRDTSKIIMVVKNGTSLYNIANMLKKEGIIYSSNLFVLTSLIYRGKLIAGEYECPRWTL
jgi:cell division protein YceG involved in septum cleavage